MQRIYFTGTIKMTDADRLELCRLLVKSGYTVRLGREHKNGSAYTYFIEYWKD